MIPWIESLPAWTVVEIKKANKTSWFGLQQQSISFLKQKQDKYCSILQEFSLKYSKKKEEKRAAQKLSQR